MNKSLCCETSWWRPQIILPVRWIFFKLPSARPFSSSGAAGPWECPECTQENEPSDEVCCACDAPRPAAAGDGDGAGNALEHYKVGSSGAMSEPLYQ